MKSFIAFILLSISVFAPRAFSCGPGDCNPKTQTWDGTKCVDNPTTPTNSQNQNQSQNSSASSNSTSNSNAASNSTSKSSSNSSATGGNSSSTAAGGSATATGGSSGVKNSGNSTLTNSGNSSNTNSSSSTATGGTQSQTAAASNDSSGNTSSYSSTYKAAAETAIAVAPYPTAQCFKGGAVGGQALTFGFSASGGRIDENCAILETARNFDSVGERLAACKVKISNKYAKAAGVTLADCMTVPLAPVVVAPAPQPAPQPTVIIVPAPAPVAVAAPVAPPQTQTATLYDIGSCKMFNLKLTNACKRVLDDAALRLENKPNAKLVLTGPVEAAQAASYLSNRVSRERLELRFSDEQNLTLGVQLFEVQ